MKILLTGAGGMLAHAVTRQAAARGHQLLACDRTVLDVTDEQAVNAAITSARPDAVIQCAAYTRVDDAEHDEDAAYAINARGTHNVARACARVGARLIYPSTDYVFDGTASAPYATTAPTAPLSAYGRTKLAGEHAAAEADALIVRTSWLYGPNGRSFVRTIVTRAREAQPLRVVDDQRGAPTYTVDLAEAMLRLLEQQAPAGVYHATNAGDTTWHGLAVAATQAAGLTVPVAAVPSSEFPQVARRPAYSVLDCSGTECIVGPLPHWRDALQRALRNGLA